MFGHWSRLLRVQNKSQFNAVLLSFIFAHQASAIAQKCMRAFMVSFTLPSFSFGFAKEAWHGLISDQNHAYLHYFYMLHKNNLLLSCRDKRLFGVAFSKAPADKEIISMRIFNEEEK